MTTRHTLIESTMEAMESLIAEQQAELEGFIDAAAARADDARRRAQEAERTGANLPWPSTWETPRE